MAGKTSSRIGTENYPILSGTERRCSFCLSSIPEKNVKKCSKCYQRVYCGVTCQKKDWKSRKGEEKNPSAELNRQGHKDWCGVPVLEEGIDREIKIGIKSSDNDARNVFAKRDVPVGTRVLIDGSHTTKHGLVFSMHDKNVIPNVEAVMDKYDLKVAIVTTCRNVAAGERITFQDFGIEAPMADWFPNGNPSKQEIVEKIKKAQDLLEGLQIIGGSRFVMASLLRVQFLHGLFRKETFDKALEKGGQSLNIFSSIYHPNGKLVKQLKAFLLQAEHIHKQVVEGRNINHVLKNVESITNTAEEFGKSNAQEATYVVQIYG